MGQGGPLWLPLAAIVGRDGVDRVIELTEQGYR